MKFLSVLMLCFVVCHSYKILSIFPYNGRSHHIFYSSLVEELARREHKVTVINYHPVQKIPNIRQILLEDKGNYDYVDMEAHLNGTINDMLTAYETAQAFKYIANTNCEKLIINHEVQDLIKTQETFDVIIVEQFVTDCGLAVAYKFNAPIVGATAHILMPWTYSRLGATNNPAFVPNHFFGSGSKPNILNRMKSFLINFGMNMYYTHVIQKSDQKIINKFYSDVPPLEDLGKNISLIMLNQYYPITGPRLYGPNVVEIGGMHINQDTRIKDKDLKQFLDTSEHRVVYVSFGTVAANFPRTIVNEIIKLIEKSKNIKFVWKMNVPDWTPSSNVYLRKWLPQVAILCHPKVVAFVTHSGMLSTSEAAHCGVPVVGVPMFGDQYANGASAVESGLGVTVNLATLDHKVLHEALQNVMQDTFQRRAKELSRLWQDRPLSPMDTAIYWIEYVARHKGVNMKPPTVDLPFYQYFMLDLLIVTGFFATIVIYIIVIIFYKLKTLRFTKKIAKNAYKTE